MDGLLMRPAVKRSKSVIRDNDPNLHRDPQRVLLREFGLVSQGR